MDTTFLTQFGGQQDISQHINRISNQNPPPPYSGMTQKIQSDRGNSPQRVGSQDRAYSSGEEQNNYALVVRRDEDDLLAKTYQSFKLQQEGMTQAEADHFQQATVANRETQYMATNPQLVMKKGKFDEVCPEFVTFKRQNITRWGIVSQLLQ